MNALRRWASSLPLALVALAALSLFGLGCQRDRGQKSAALAARNVESLVKLTDEDVAEVERGLPVGATKITALLEAELGADGDPTSNAPAVRRALLTMRRQVPDLGIAKSTFFALADGKGVAIRNDFEQDSMAGKDLLAGWPGLRPALEGAPYAATTGRFPGAPHPSGPDKEWVAAVPLKRGDTTAGILLTGWTYRRFAYHLQVMLEREVQDELLQKGDKIKMPILYVCLFDKEHVYAATAPGSIPVPEVNIQALSALGLHHETAEGAASAPIHISHRDFGWAAARLPRLDPDVGVVVLRSEF